MVDKQLGNYMVIAGCTGSEYTATEGMHMSVSFSCRTYLRALFSVTLTVSVMLALHSMHRLLFWSTSLLSVLATVLFCTYTVSWKKCR